MAPKSGVGLAMMSLAQKKSSLPAAEERRRFQRVKVHLLGRYMLPDRREFPCQIINMSPGGVALLAPGIGNVGDRVIAYPGRFPWPAAVIRLKPQSSTGHASSTIAPKSNAAAALPDHLE